MKQIFFNYKGHEGYFWIFFLPIPCCFLRRQLHHAMFIDTQIYCIPMFFSLLSNHALTMTLVLMEKMMTTTNQIGFLVLLLYLENSCTIGFVFQTSPSFYFPSKKIFKQFIRDNKVISNEKHPLLNHEICYFSQILEHLTYILEGYKFFKKRYLINKKISGGEKNRDPIFVYTGNNDTIKWFANNCKYQPFDTNVTSTK